MNETEELKIENGTDLKNGVASCLLLNEEVEGEMKKCERPSLHDVTVENVKGGKQTILSKISEHLDLNLLKDSRYVAVILGKSLISTPIMLIIPVFSRQHSLFSESY